MVTYNCLVRIARVEPAEAARSGSHSTSVTSTAIRKNSQRGTELIRVTTGHARQAKAYPYLTYGSLVTVIGPVGG